MYKGAFRKTAKIIILILVILTAMKILLVGYDIDEQYAITLSYRLLRGDFLLLDMWEPHQTSAFVCAFLMYLFLLITKSTTGIVLYLRIMGLIIHFLITTLLYRYINDYKDKEYSFLIAGVYFFSLPKLAFLPEFANLQIWFLTLMIFCFLKYYQNRERKYAYVYLFLVSLLLSLEVLTYPSSILLFPVGIILIIVFREQKRLLKELLIFIVPCIIYALLFVGMLLSQMSLSILLEMVSLTMQDGSHSATILDKILLNGKSIFEILTYFTIYGLTSIVLYMMINKKLKVEDKLLLFINTYFTVSICGQMYIWIFQNRYPNYPMIEYFLLPLLYVLFILIRKREMTYHIAFFVVFPFFAFVGVIVFTNHPILVSAPFLIPSIVGILSCPISEQEKHKRNNLVYKGVLLLWLMVLLFGRMYMTRTTGGTHYPINYGIEKMDTGIAVGILADAKTVKQYNGTKELVDEYIEENSSVFYLGHSNDIYLMKDMEVCSPSTISTPTFDSKIDLYFELHPEKKPQYVILEKGLENEWISEYIERVCSGNIIAENEYLLIYQTIIDQ